MRKANIAIIIAGLTLGAGTAVAQTQSDPQQQQQQMQQPVSQQQNVQLNDANLLKFSVAMDSIQQIGDKYEGKFQNADNQEQAQKIQQQAQVEMVDAVKAAGLTPEQYNEIARQAQQDEELRSKILAMSNGKPEKEQY